MLRLANLRLGLIGWDLILEYAISNAAVAVSWSGYFQALLSGLGAQIPPWLGTDYRSALQAAAQVAASPDGGATLAANVLRTALAWQTAPQILGLRLIFNLPAFGIVVLVTWVVLVGIKETARFNAVLAVGKLIIIVFFLTLGAMYIDPENWAPFAPNGLRGISSAAAIIFFAYIGFDAVSTAAEETKDPQRNMPIGIISALIVCTVIYIAVAVVLTGMAKWNTLGNAEPLAAVFSDKGMRWTAGIVAVGALLATTSALVPYQAGQPRIFFAMSRDGLLPAWAAKVHPRWRTPYTATLITGGIVAVCSSVANINELVELTNIGTLFAFAMVAIGILILRYKEPNRLRPFRTPLVPWVPLAGVACCVYLMCHLPAITWIWFFGWMAAGLAVYVLYGIRRSRLSKTPQPRNS